MNDARTHRAQAAADDILEFVNAYGFDSDTFAKRIAGGHKTLQQSVMRLFVRTIREMANVLPDDRNAAAVKLAKQITELADGVSLPMI